MSTPVRAAPFSPPRDYHPPTPRPKEIVSPNNKPTAPSPSLPIDPLLHILNPLHAAGKLDATHSFLDPAAHQLQSAPAPERTQTAFRALLSKTPQYVCHYRAEQGDAAYTYTFSKSCESLLEWIFDFAEFHRIAVKGFLRGSECAQS